MSKNLADAMRVLLEAYTRVTYSDTKVGEDIEETCARQALEAFEARTLADDCHDLARRVRAVHDAKPHTTALWPIDLASLRALDRYATLVGNAAAAVPHLYKEDAR